MAENALTPRTITELKQVSPEEISLLSESVMEADRVMNQATGELEVLSDSLYSLSATKEKYDEMSREVKSQMRGLITKM